MAAIILIIIMLVILGLIAVRPAIPALRNFRSEYAHMGKQKRMELWRLVGIFTAICIISSAATVLFESESGEQGGDFFMALLVGGIVLFVVLAILAVCIIYIVRNNSVDSEDKNSKTQ